MKISVSKMVAIPIQYPYAKGTKRNIIYNLKNIFIYNYIQIILGSYYFTCSSMNFYWLFFFFSHYYRKISKIILYSAGLI